jgi:hypothetical protein
VKGTATPNTLTPIKNAEGRTGLFGFFRKLLKGRPRFPVLGGFVLNSTSLIPQFIDGVPIQWNKVRGYFIDKGGKIIRVFQRGNKLVSQQGQQSQSVQTTPEAKEKFQALLHQ